MYLENVYIFRNNRFIYFAATAEFMQMREDVLESVVDDDRLISRSEVAVWEAVVG
jgi:hypothetical protein